MRTFYWTTNFGEKPHRGQLLGFVTVDQGGGSRIKAMVLEDGLITAVDYAELRLDKTACTCTNEPDITCPVHGSLSQR